MRALMTQREEIDRYGGHIDVLEEGYVKFFQDIGVDVFPVSNFRFQIDSLWDACPWDFLILTGGGSVPDAYFDEKIEAVQQQAHRDRVESELVKECTARKIPILGICRGMQFLNGLYGGRVSHLAVLPAERPVGIDHPVVLWDGRIITVNNYHNDGIFMENLAPCFRPWAVDEENSVVEGFYSESLKICALQWHPERKFSTDFAKSISKDIVVSVIESAGSGRFGFIQGDSCDG